MNKSIKDMDTSIKDDVELVPNKGTGSIELVPNKGTGAGGSNTTKFGSDFERITDNEQNLISSGYTKNKINGTKYGYYYKYNVGEKEIVFVKQSGLKYYCGEFFNMKGDDELFRNPDEAYIVKDIVDGVSNTTVIIIEKKEQRVEGSVELKMWVAFEEANPIPL